MFMANIGKYRLRKHNGLHVMDRFTLLLLLQWVNVGERKSDDRFDFRVSFSKKAVNNRGFCVLMFTRINGFNEVL